MYTLIFSGELITGFARDQVIDNLAALLEQSQQEVGRNLFSGETVVISSHVPEEAAIQWRRDFADAGAVLIMTDAEQGDGSRYQRVITEEPSLGSLAAQVPSARRRTRGYAWMGLLTLGLIALVVMVLSLSRPLWQTAGL